MFTLLGHETVIQHLQSALADGRIHHAYLITGPAHLGKLTLAIQLAQAVNCLSPEHAPCGSCIACLKIAASTHPDVRVVEPDPQAENGFTVISIELVRELIGTLHLRPYEGRKRVYIFNRIEDLKLEAANALLKTLEEPPPDVILILLGESSEDVLPTVRSRCQLLEMRPLPISHIINTLVSKYETEPEQANMIGRLSDGCIGWAIQAIHDPTLLAGVHQSFERIVHVIEDSLVDRFGYADELTRRFRRDRIAVIDELNLWLLWLRDLLMIQQGRNEAIVNLSWSDTLTHHAGALTPSEVLQWSYLIINTVNRIRRNANPQLSFDAMVLDAPALRHE